MTAAFLFATATLASAQTPSLPVPAAPVARDVPGAKELPDKTLTYKIIQSLKKAGVDFRVCGQAVLARKIDPKTIQPEIELDLWALTTITTLEMRGWVRVGS
jgi:hypothetical protein